jgi:hypothetical protein
MAIIYVMFGYMERAYLISINVAFIAIRWWMAIQIQNLYVKGHYQLEGNDLSATEFNAC